MRLTIPFILASLLTLIAPVAGQTGVSVLVMKLVKSLSIAIKLLILILLRLQVEILFVLVSWSFLVAIS